MNNSTIRAVRSSDLPFLKAVIDQTGLFPSEMLDDMIAPFFSNKDCKAFWLTYELEQPVAVAYCSPEHMTEGAWNLLLIAVSPDHQGQGIGASIMTHVESLLAQEGERILLVETSALPEFSRTRAFYHQCQYVEEARIRDYYQAGEDKVVFWKQLSR